MARGAKGNKMRSIGSQSSSPEISPRRLPNLAPRTKPSSKEQAAEDLKKNEEKRKNFENEIRNQVGKGKKYPSMPVLSKTIFGSKAVSRLYNFFSGQKLNKTQLEKILEELPDLKDKIETFETSPEYRALQYKEPRAESPGKDTPTKVAFRYIGSKKGQTRRKIVTEITKISSYRLSIIATRRDDFSPEEFQSLLDGGVIPKGTTVSMPLPTSNKRKAGPDPLGSSSKARAKKRTSDALSQNEGLAPKHQYDHTPMGSDPFQPSMTLSQNILLGTTPLPQPANLPCIDPRLLILTALPEYSQPMPSADRGTATDLNLAGATGFYPMDMPPRSQQSGPHPNLSLQMADDQEISDFNSYLSMNGFTGNFLSFDDDYTLYNTGSASMSQQPKSSDEDTAESENFPALGA